MFLMESLVDHVQQVELREHVSLRELTTVSVGGTARWMFEVHSESSLCQLVRLMRAEGICPAVLGAGSNSLFPDTLLEVPLLRLAGDFKRMSVSNDGSVFVGAAVGLMRLARRAAQDGWSGLEFAGGIPASIGGAVVMNAGAHGGEIGECVTAVRCVLPDGKIVEIPQADLNFSYRSCLLPAEAIVVGAHLSLTRSDQGKVGALLAQNLDYRKRTQPLTVPSFGSTFRNPSLARTAGELVEQCGLKGKSVGQACISPLHANWIVNPSRSARYQDVISLIGLVQRQVLEQTGEGLVTEVIDWGHNLNC